MPTKCIVRKSGNYMKKKEIPKSCDCRNCMNAGEAKDFMVFCSVLNIYRSVGIRPYCAKFKNK